MDDLITRATSGDERRRGRAVAVLPVRSFEQHGERLPLTTDTLIACMIARRIADDHGLFLLPPVTVSCSHEHAPLAGTVSISAPTLYAVVDDIWRSLDASGVPGLLIVNGHGGNYVLSNLVQELNVGGPRVALFPAPEDRRRARADAVLTSSAEEDMHGGEFEVSLLLHGAPDAVGAGIAADDHSAPDRTHLLTVGVAGYTPHGIIGRPSLATAAKGRALLDSLSSSARAHLALIDGRYAAGEGTRSGADGAP
ncbi:creatininase family protein [Streptomyces marincola]|uniref:creatininase family protein n=1 Tax=Streptomyces marincola TaxID=2878388 RepID=UPI001CF3E82F|nr:creatininase family protein [Streptomyces marincola]UCM90051.1 creatininase family protein [Streptomyces marincola]